MKALTKFALLMAAFLLYLGYMLSTREERDRKSAFSLLLIGAVCSVVTAIGYEVAE